jgi:outer membrane biosynthesis protein TonB
MHLLSKLTNLLPTRTLLFAALFFLIVSISFGLIAVKGEISSTGNGSAAGEPEPVVKEEPKEEPKSETQEPAPTTAEQKSPSVVAEHTTSSHPQPTVQPTPQPCK